MDPEPHLPFEPLPDAAAFTAAYGQLFLLLELRPLPVARLQSVWAAMDEYTQRHPCPTWPLALTDAQGTRWVMATLPDLLLQMSLEGLPQN